MASVSSGGKAALQAKAAVPATIITTSTLGSRVERHGQRKELLPSLRRRQRRERLTAVPKAFFKGPSTALGRHRSDDVIGVVIVDAGRRTVEGDELLLDFAAAYGQAYRRDIVAVANPGTLEAAVADCVAEGANKVMVVPYLLSRRRAVVGEDLPAALADVQLKMPGVRCIIGESISVETLLAQHIENQVQVVDAKAPDVAERSWSYEAEEQRQQERAVAANYGSAALPPAQQSTWGDAVGNAGSQQAFWEAQFEAEPTVEPEPVVGAWAAATPRAAAAAPIPQPAAPTPVAWSDDFSAALTGGVLVVDYRKADTKTAAAGAASVATAPAATATATASDWRLGDGIGGAQAGGSGPAYWYTNTDNSSASSGHSGSSWGSGGGSGDHTSHWADYDAASAHDGSSSVVGASGDDLAWQETAPADSSVAGGRSSAAPLESRLASVEGKLSNIADMLQRQWASRRGGQSGAGADTSDPVNYSPEQLEFLRRKEQQNFGF